MPIGITKSGNGRVNFIKQGMGGKVNLVPFIEPPGGGGSNFTILDIGLGEGSFYVLRSDNTLWVWGGNFSGELGTGVGSAEEQLWPVQVTGTGGAGQYFDRVWASQYVMYARKLSDGTLWGCGINSYDGNLGIGDVVTDYIYELTQITTPSGPQSWNWLSTQQGYSWSTMGIKSNGTLWGWGQNQYGCLGLGHNIPQNIPVQVGSDTDWVAVSTSGEHSIALKADGSIWTCGSNQYGQLGNGLTDPFLETSNYTFVRRSIPNTYNFVYASAHNTYAIRSNGTLWACGRNLNGSLGIGSIPDPEFGDYPITPYFTQVGVDADWVTVHGWDGLVVGGKSNGTIRTWGRALEYGIGNGTDTPDQSSPIVIDASTDWQLFKTFYIGDVFAVKNNELYYWGGVYPYSPTPYHYWDNPSNLPNIYLHLYPALALTPTRLPATDYIV